MNFFITLIVFIGLFAMMAIGFIIAKKTLQKGCALDPDECKCRQEGKDPDKCEYEPTKNTNSL